MSVSNFPHEWEELLAGYVLGDLTTEEVTQMQQLIAEHPEIIQEIDRLQETLALLPLSLKASHPAPNLRDRIAAAAIPVAENFTNNIVDSLAPEVRQVQRRQNFWKLLGIGLGSISAIAIVGLGFDNYQMRQQIATDRIELHKYKQAIAQLQASDNRMISLKGMGAIPAATGSVTIAPMEKTAMIDIQNLMPIPQENSYRLWAIVDGKKIDCAQFRPDTQGKVFLKVPLGSALKQSNSLIITIEPNKDMPEPTGEMVMKGEV